MNDIEQMTKIIAIQELTDIAEVEDREMRLQLISQWVKNHF